MPPPDQDPGTTTSAGGSAGPAPAPAVEGALCIRADGSWTHEGTTIRRLALVRLFASVLRREGDRYWLVTPVERVEVEVEDAPFVGVELTALGAEKGQQLQVRTNLDAWVTIGPEHPLTMRRPRHPDAGEAEAAPYVEVRPGVDARLLRPVYYQLVELAVEEGRRLGVWSGGAFFDLGEGSA